MTRKQSFRGDERAIEGLPIRLVIALVVGVASLAIMMNLLGGIGTVGETEVDIETTGDGIESMTDSSGNDKDATFTIQVVDNEGKAIDGESTVIISGKNVELVSGTITETVEGETDITIEHDQIDFRSDQVKGTLEVTVEPPGDGNYKDDQPAELTVTK
ncbi:hypothetical protein [Halorientalis sp. IM1011]|uniref:hypothetical protein n=1 Tax=Halorientalis sp. IM1011 TaxID=1932360 RepID=UPI000A075CED|nr:hypothetical protein [Halorientalis sp. IM1011]